MKQTKEFLHDLYELLNNLNDDLGLDLKYGENGHHSYRESHDAIKKYTLVVLKRKIKKWTKEYKV